MKIHPLYRNFMTLSGSNLLKSMPKSTLSMLDILVREVLQNSLDAVKGDVDNVYVDFSTGEFSSEDLINNLECVGKGLQKYSKNGLANYISIRDSNTIGLEGKLNPQDVGSTTNEHLFNLVYDALNPKKDAGAGGSWGIGKTIYYQVGIGLVLFYSRIYDKNKNIYQERLAGVLVENESSKELVYNNDPKESNEGKYLGIAFFGDEYEEGKTRPITDSAFIKEFIKIFNLKPYEGDQTGTTIIIPYIDKDKLMKGVTPYNSYWNESIESSLSLLIQRWYFPRIGNESFLGSFLKPSINGKMINADNMATIFNSLKKLYNLTIDQNNIPQEFNNENLIIEQIVLKEFNSHVGIFVCYKFIKFELDMVPPHNEQSPYFYINYELSEDGENVPIVMYLRKPGMIVSYEVENKKWIGDGVFTDNDEFLVGIFRLNYQSETFDGLSIEDYFRESERQDHFDWTDHSQKNYLSRIQRQIKKKISEKFGPLKEEPEARVSTNLSKKLGELFLPPESFGNMPSTPKNKPKEEGYNKPNYKIIFSSPEYTPDSINFKIRLITKKKSKCIKLEWVVATIQKNYNRQQWEEMGLEYPLELFHLGVHINKINNLQFDGTNPWMKFFKSGSEFIVDNKFYFSSLDYDNRNFGLNIGTFEELNISTFDIDIYLKFKIKNMSCSTSFEVTFEEM